MIVCSPDCSKVSLPLPQQRFRSCLPTYQSDQWLVSTFCGLPGSLPCLFLCCLFVLSILSFCLLPFFFVFSAFVLSLLFWFCLFCLFSSLTLLFFVFPFCLLVPGSRLWLSSLSDVLGTASCRTYRNGSLAAGRGSGRRTDRLRSAASPQCSHSVDA
jgi:hypothetical protein